MPKFRVSERIGAEASAEREIFAANAESAARQFAHRVTEEGRAGHAIRLFVVCGRGGRRETIQVAGETTSLDSVTTVAAPAASSSAAADVTTTTTTGDDKSEDLFDGVIGGRELPKQFIRDDLVERGGEIASEMDRRIARLLTLHPDLAHEFGSVNLAELDECGKEDLLNSLQKALNIIPTQKPTINR